MEFSLVCGQHEVSSRECGKLREEGVTWHHIPEECSSQPRYCGNLKNYKEEATRGMRNLHREEMHDWYSFSKLIHMIK
jgi:hypothetical protein